MEQKILEKLVKLYKKSLKNDDFPVAAIIYDNNKNKIIAKSYNKRKKTNRTIDHAEIISINIANKKQKNWRLDSCIMYVTLEPCEMCQKVINESRISKVYYLLERKKEKQQFKGTKYEVFSSNNEVFVQKLKEKYKDEIKDFFVDKR